MYQEEEMIAEFLGWKKHGEYYETTIRTTAYNSITEDHYEKTEHSLDEFEFQYSWDWLILVVEKIESLNFEVTIIGTNCVIKRLSFDKGFKIFFDNSDYKIKSVYNTCLKFIKDYDSKRV